MKSLSTVWRKRESPWKGRKAEWVQMSQNRFVLCGLQLLMCRLHKYERKLQTLWEKMLEGSTASLKIRSSAHKQSPPESPK